MSLLYMSYHRDVRDQPPSQNARDYRLTLLGVKPATTFYAGQIRYSALTRAPSEPRQPQQVADERSLALGVLT